MFLPPPFFPPLLVFPQQFIGVQSGAHIIGQPALPSSAPASVLSEARAQAPLAEGEVADLHRASRNPVRQATYYPYFTYRKVESQTC